jgi:hypothetical protein
VLTDLKCDALTRRIKRLLSHILFSAFLPPFTYLIFISLPFIHHIFIYSFSTACFFPSLHAIKSKELKYIYIKGPLEKNEGKVSESFSKFQVC